MNTTPNPLIPKGTFLEQKGRSHIRLAVFTILAVHVVLLGSLLMAGCKRTTDGAATEQATNDVGLYPAPPVTAVPAATETPQPPAITDAATGGVAAITNPGSIPPGPGGTTVTGVTTEVQPQPPVPTADHVLVATPQGEHVVMKGDSFSTIAKKYGVTSRAIQEANPGVEPTRLKIGQKLVIPAKTGSATTATATAAPTNGGTGAAKTYTVKSGDTLNTIAKRNGITVKELQAANNLTTTRITVGQKLRIPSKEATAPTP
jgi:LysM repeat protein